VRYMFQTKQELEQQNIMVNQVPKVRSSNELLSLCYISFLNSNNYLKGIDQSHLHGELF